MAQRPKLMERQKMLGEKAVDLHKVVYSTFRLSKVPVEEKRLVKYEEEFKKNHSDLVNLGVTSDDYFEKNYFYGITQMFEEIRDACRILNNKGKSTVPIVIEKKPLSPPVGEESDVEFFKHTLERLNKGLGMLHIDVKTESYAVLEVVKEMVERQFKHLKRAFEDLRKTSHFISASIQMDKIEKKYVIAHRLITRSMFLENDEDVDLDINSITPGDSSSPRRFSPDLTEEDSFVTRFANPSPSSQLLQNPNQLEEKYKEKFVPALTPPLNLLKKIPVTVKSKDSLPESTSKEAMKENRVENKTELFGMQELDDQFIKSVEVSGLNLQTTSTETTPKEVDSMSKTEKIPRERPEWQGEEGRPLPGSGRGAGFVAVSKRASVVSMVGKIPPLPQQLEERPQSEPDWDAEEGQIDTPKNSEGTPKRECMEHDQIELPIPSEKSGPSARLWSTEWRKGDDGSGPSVGYQRGPPGSITHHPPALMNFPVKPSCSFHEGPIPPLFLNKRNMTYTDPNILKKQQAAQASAVTTANQKWHPYRIILDIGISGKDDAKRLLNEVKQQIGEELKAEAIKTDTKDDIKADIKDDVSSLSTLDEDSQNPIETNDIKPKDEVEDKTDIKPSIEDTPTDAINVDYLQAFACMQVYQCKFEMEMLFLQENKLNLQKYAKNSQTNKSFFVTAATPSKLSSTIGILPALPTSFLKSPKPPPEVSNNIVDANREAIKMTISPMKLLSKPAIFNTSLSEELDRRIKGVDDNDEIEFTEKLVKPAKEVAIVKPMMETQLSDSQRQHCTPKI